jgi:hypothetical protein
MDFLSIPKLQLGHFVAFFYELPVASYDDDFPEEPFHLDDPGIDIHHGDLFVDFAQSTMERGSFKTAHPGTVTLADGATLPPFTNQKVCIKQVYEKRGDGNAIGQVKGRHELDAFAVECNCLRWASILLDLTYQFISREINARGEPPFHIPQLRFTRVMIAIVQDTSLEKAFLIEEWIDTDERDYPFVKYIDNRTSLSCVPDFAPPHAHDKAEFLSFAQHVQWEKSQRSAFTSDYQGAGKLLTDPQITSNPFVLSHCVGLKG